VKIFPKKKRTGKNGKRQGKKGWGGNRGLPKKKHRSSGICYRREPLKPQNWTAPPGTSLYCGNGRGKKRGGAVGVTPEMLNRMLLNKQPGGSLNYRTLLGAKAFFL